MIVRPLTPSLVALALLLPALGCTRRAPALPPVGPPAIATPAVGAPATQAERDVAAVRESLLVADRALGTAGRPVVEAIPAMLDADGLVLEEGAAVLTGPGAVRAFLAATPTNATTVQTWAPIRADVSADGTYGYTYGFGTLTTPAAAGGTPTRAGIKYAAAWRRAQGGDWRVAAYVRIPAPLPASTAMPADFERPAPRPAPPVGRADAAATRAALLAADEAFSTAAQTGGVRQAFVAFAAPDAAMLGQGPGMTFGPAAIGEAFATFPSDAGLVWHPIAADGAASGDLGFTVGEAVLRGRGPKGEVRERGTKYLSIWQRQPDGVWRFVMDGGNSRPTATLTPRRGHPSR